MLPLMDGGHVLADDVHALPVYKELGHSYLAQPNEEAAIDHAKPVFAVQTRLVSSLYTQDAILAQVGGCRLCVGLSLVFLCLSVYCLLCNVCLFVLCCVCVRIAYIHSN